jgi:hypothetical protein
MEPFHGIETPPSTALSKPIIRTIYTGVFLLLLGLFLFFLGFAMWNQGQDKLDWIPAMLLGGISVIPGLYVVVLAYGAQKKWKGYTWEALPIIQEEEEVE